MHALAGLVTHHYEELHPTITINQLNDALKTDAWNHYKQWCRGKKIVCPTSSVFSAQRFGREKWQSYPELATCYKGAMVKYLIFWVASFLNDKLSELNTEFSRLRAFCSWSLARFQWLQEVNGPWLSNDVATELHDAGRSFLLFYQKLATEARNACPGKKMYKLVPKFHCMLHLCLHTKITGRNPRFDHLYMEEDFLKHVAKICGKCHPNTMHMVALFRYRALIELAQPAMTKMGLPTRHGSAPCRQERLHRCGESWPTII